MNSGRKPRPIIYSGALLGALAAWAASADTASSSLQNGLQRCAAIAGRDARLDCFDALASRGANSADGAVPSAATAPALAPSGAAAPIVRPAAQAPTAASSSAQETPAATSRPEDFGLRTSQMSASVKQLVSITAHVVGFARNGDGGILVKLDNGQSWELDAADPLLAPGDSITIRRAALGSFMMKTPTGRTHKVRRTL